MATDDGFQITVCESDIERDDYAEEIEIFITHCFPHLSVTI